MQCLCPGDSSYEMYACIFFTMNSVKYSHGMRKCWCGLANSADKTPLHFTSLSMNGNDNTASAAAAAAASEKTCCSDNNVTTSQSELRDAVQDAGPVQNGDASGKPSVTVAYSCGKYGRVSASIR